MVGWLQAISSEIGTYLQTIASAVRPNDTATSRAQTHDDILATSQTGNGLKTQLPAGAAQDGTDAPSATGMLSGGIAARGWLSSSTTYLSQIIGQLVGVIRMNDAATNRMQTHDDTLAAAQAGVGVKVADSATETATTALQASNAGAGLKVQGAVTDTATASLQASNAGAGVGVAVKPTQSTPADVTIAIAVTSTSFGTPGSYHAMTIQAQGQPMCVTFGTGTPTAPSNAGVCAVGMYLAAGQGFTYTLAAIPSSQGKAAALAAGGSIWESTQ